jgi:hypothetical protein
MEFLILLLIEFLKAVAKLIAKGLWTLIKKRIKKPPSRRKRRKGGKP